MASAEYLSSSRLRDLARECRKLAETIHPDARDKVFEVAARYEALAAQAEETYQQTRRDGD